MSDLSEPIPQPVRKGRPGVLLLTFGLLSVGAVLVGAFVCASSGVPATSWSRNILAWLVAAVAAAGISMIRPLGAARAALVATPLTLIATLFGVDQSGVHRWIDLGPLHVNVAMLLLPAMVVALAALGREQRWPWTAALIALAALVWQPDASQATVLALAMIVVASRAAFSRGLRASLIAAALLLATLAWLRPDDLQPVAEVEEIYGLAYSVSPMAAGLALLLSAALVAVPVIFTQSTSADLQGWAFSACLFVWMVAPALGAFPVPLVGLGLSPIIGAWLGAGLLASYLRRTGSPARAA